MMLPLAGAVCPFLFTQNKFTKVEIVNHRKYNIEERSTGRRRKRKMGFDFSTLNDSQMEAVTHTEGPLLILAGAGTGKTHTLNARVSYLIEKKGVSPESILLLTFTNDAAGEMKERIGNDDVMACTFHSFCVRMLRQYGDHIGMSRGFTVISDDDAADAMRFARGTLGPSKVDKKKFPTDARLVSILSAMRNRHIPLSEALKRGEGQFEKEISVIFQAYTIFKMKNVMLDFDDLLDTMDELLSRDEKLRMRLDERFRYVMVDEYQDTNVTQASIVMKLCRDYPNLCVVGDDMQSIYKFRGADISNILEFPKRVQGCHVVKLERNYRSTEEILELANNISDDSAKANSTYRKSLYSGGNGFIPHVIGCASQEGECREAADIMRKAYESGMTGAVLARTRKEIETLEPYIKASGIPYRKTIGLALMDRTCVRNYLCMFRIAVNPDDILAQMRMFVMIPGIGDKKAEKLATGGMRTPPEEHAYIMRQAERMRHDAPSAAAVAFETYVTLFRSKNKTEDIPESERRILQTLVGMYGGQMDEYLDMMTTSGTEDSEDAVIVLSTIHRAKGLEYDAVVVLNCRDRLFPMNAKDPEEMRLYYVAVTRARKFLYMLYPMFDERTGGRRGRRLYWSTLLDSSVDDMCVRDMFER